MAGGGLKRDWTVEVESERPEHWLPDTGAPVAIVPVENEDQLLTEIVNAAWVLRRFGGIVSQGAVREEIAPDIYETTAIAFHWESYGPTKKLPREERQPVVAATSPEPVAAAPAPAEPAPPPAVAPEPELVEDEDGFDEPLPEGDDGFGDGEVIDERRIDASRHPEATAADFFDTSVPVSA